MKFKDDQEEYQTLTNMKKFGGSFVVQLALLYELGDHSNKNKLLLAFPEYFTEYRDWK